MTRITIFQRIYLKICNVFYKYRFEKKVINTKPIVLEENTEIVVAILSSHKNTIESIASIKSFYRFLNIKFQVNYHDDGTLTKNDKQLLKKHIIGINIIDKSVADVDVNGYFDANELLYCKKLRNENNVNKKLFDFPFYANGKKTLQIDTDVLCFQKPSKLLELIQEGKSCYNLDRGNAYAYAQDVMSGFLNKPVLDRFNGGLVAFTSNFQELYEFCEKFLKTNPISYHDWVREQTLLCMYLTLKNSVALPRNYDLAYQYVLDENNSEFGNTVTQHYCSWARNTLKIDFIRKIHPFLEPHNVIYNHFKKIVKGEIIP